MRLSDYSIKDKEDIYLEDIPRILHPKSAYSDLSSYDPKRRHPSFSEEDHMPSGYSWYITLNQSHSSLLSEIESGNKVLVHKSWDEIFGVVDYGDKIKSDVPLFLRSRLEYIIENQEKKPWLPFYNSTKKDEPHQLISECLPEDNPLLNGVYIWTEVTGTGHAFVSVHENNQIYLYSYGRYGRTGGPLGSVGDGILDFMTGEDARSYYRYELYSHNARVFLINDANIKKTRSFFENAWIAGKKPIKADKDITVRTGHTIDKYDVTGSNCTTHSVAGVKSAGSSVFSIKQNTLSQLPLEATEDFAIPVSLQKYLIGKSHDLSSMQVMEMTGEFKKQYANIFNEHPKEPSAMDKLENGAANSASAIGELSPYSGGSVNGVLGDIYDVKD